MKILCFDTSLDKTYIALGFDGFFEQIQINSDEKNYHSAYLLPKIKEILKRAKITPKDVNAIVTNCGPGSFTGIRAALSVAKVMALELDLPVVRLNSCDILKNAALKHGVKNPCVVLDARRGMYYFYDGSEIKLVLKDNLADLTRDYNVVCDSNVYKDFSCHDGARFINYEDQNYPLAEVMYNLGLEKINSSKDIVCDFSHTKLKANYIQTPPVFTKG